MYVETSGKFISKDKSEKNAKLEGQDVVVQKLRKHIVLCLHWKCLVSNEKEIC